MSRLLSFLKKKDRDEDFPSSPPPSPKAKCKDSEPKSVKQVKKRNRKDKRKRPSVSVAEEEDSATSVDNVSRDNNVDANGNSTTGKGCLSSNFERNLVIGSTSKSTEEEADSLRDVDSICEDEIGSRNGLHTITAQSCSTSDRTVGVVADDMETQATDHLNFDGSGRVNGVHPILNEADIEHLVDDFMDEAFEDLEGEAVQNNFSRPHSPDNFIAGSGCEPCSDIPRNGVSAYTTAADNLSYNGVFEFDLHHDEEAIAPENSEYLSTNGNGVRALSTATVYSSCGPGSDCFESDNEDFSSALNGKEEDAVEQPAGTNSRHVSDVGLDASGQNDVELCAADHSGHVETRCDTNPDHRPASRGPDLAEMDDIKSPAVDDSHLEINDEEKPQCFEADNVNKLEVCLELEAKGCTSVIVTDIIEARNNCYFGDISENDATSDSGVTIKVEQNGDINNKTIIDENGVNKIIESNTSVVDSEGSEMHMEHSNTRVIIDAVCEAKDTSITDIPFPEQCDSVIAFDALTYDAYSSADQASAAFDSVPEVHATDSRLEGAALAAAAPDVTTCNSPSQGNAVSEGSCQALHVANIISISLPQEQENNFVASAYGTSNACTSDTMDKKNSNSDVFSKIVDNTGALTAINDDGKVVEKTKPCYQEDYCYTSDDIHHSSPISVDEVQELVHCTDSDMDDSNLSRNAEQDSSNYSETGNSIIEESRTNNESDLNEVTSNTPPNKSVSLETVHKDNLKADTSFSAQVADEGALETTDKDTSFTPSTQDDDSVSTAGVHSQPGSPDYRKASRSLEHQLSVEEVLSRCEHPLERQQAEARLAQRRAARAEARELRLKELEKQQQHNPENTDDASDMSDGGSGGRSAGRSARPTVSTGTVPPAPPLPHYSRRSSEDSTNEDANTKEIRELEEKFRGAMISNAQLDNEKSQLTYQVELLKDVRADITEQLTQLKKEHKKKCSEHEQLRKVYAKLQEECKMVRRVLEERDELIQEYGLVVVGGEEEEEEEEHADDSGLLNREETEDGLVLPRPVPMKRVLLTQEATEILQKGAAKGSLEWRLRSVVEHKRELEDELRRVNLELEDHINSQRYNNCLDSSIQKEANKTVNEYKFRVQKAEAEVSSLQANVNRLEALVARYKTQSEELEKSEEELKLEKRKLQRELREANSSLEELGTTNTHLMRRFDKLKNARSNLLKDLSQDPV